MKNYKRLIALILIAVMALTGMAMNIVSAAKLTDAYKYATKGAVTGFDLAEAINVLQQKGIVAGVSQVTDRNGNVTDYTFDGDSLVTRQQFALFTARIESGNPERFVVASNGDVRTKTKFKDLVDKTYTLAIDYCYEKGYILGRDAENTVFDPTGNITFAEAVTMLTRTLGYRDLSYPTGFMTKAADKDVKLIGTYADFQMNNVAQNTRITRAEMAMLLWNYLLSGSDEMVYDDNTEDTSGDDNVNTPINEYRNKINEINSVVEGIESKYYNNKGYVDIEDFDRVMVEVVTYVQQLYEQGKILEYEYIGHTIHITVEADRYWGYTPKNDEILSGGSGDVQITTISSDKGLNDIQNNAFPQIGSNLALAFRNDYSWSVHHNDYVEAKVTIDTIMELSGKVVLWNSHGMQHDNRVGTLLQTGMKVSPKEYEEKRKFYLDKSETGYWYVAPDGTYVLQNPKGRYYFEESSRGYWYITAEFINDKLSKDCFKSALVYLKTCYSLENKVLSDAFRNKGASVVIGNMDTIETIYSTYFTEQFISKMMEKYSKNSSSSSYSVSEALAWAKKQIPINFDFFTWNEWRDKYASLITCHGDELFRFTDWNEPESTGVKGKVHLTENGQELPFPSMGGIAKITNIDTGREYTGFINSTGAINSHTYSFEIGGCPAGKYTLAISRDGKAFYDVDLIFDVKDKQVTDLGDVYAEIVGQTEDDETITIILNPGNSDTIQGRVVDETKAELQGIRVEIYDGNDNYIGETMTDVNGKFGFSVDSGRYKLKYIAPSGYQIMNIYSPGPEYIDVKPPVISGAYLVPVISSVYVELTLAQTGTSPGGGTGSSGNGFSVISAGGSLTMAIKNDGSLWAWGHNKSGQLGDGTTENRLTPIKIMDGVTQVLVGHTDNLIMAIKSDGSLWAWEANYGWLGDGATEERHMPIKIMDGVAQVSGGGFFFAIKNDGSLWAWGWNWDGELGNGIIRDKDSPPVKIMDGVVQVSVGESHTLAIKNDGSLWAWGDNWSGRLGDGTTESRLTPVKIMDGVVQVSAGNGHTLAIKNDGSLWAWGWNDYGQVGDGTTESRLTPVKIMDGVVQVSAGAVHSMAIKNDGSLWAWGWNRYGRLGNGTTKSEQSPIKIMDGVAQVSAGANYTVVIKNDGSLWAWGDNDDGQLGDGTTEDRYSPVKISD